jgi:hypothetical protein
MTLPLGKMYAASWVWVLLESEEKSLNIRKFEEMIELVFLLCSFTVKKGGGKFSLIIVYFFLI